MISVYVIVIIAVLLILLVFLAYVVNQGRWFKSSDLVRPNAPNRGRGILIDHKKGYAGEIVSSVPAGDKMSFHIIQNGGSELMTGFYARNEIIAQDIFQVMCGWDSPVFMRASDKAIMDKNFELAKTLEQLSELKIKYNDLEAKYMQLNQDQEFLKQRNVDNLVEVMKSAPKMSKPKF